MKHVYDVPSEMLDRLMDEDQHSLELLQELAEVLGEESYLTVSPAQRRCLLVGPWAEGWDVPDVSLSLHHQDDDGWLIVGCPAYWDRDPDTGEVEQDGVWMDTGGVVWYGPTGADGEAERMADPTDSHPVVLLEHDPDREDLDPEIAAKIDAAPESAVFVSVSSDPLGLRQRTED